MHVSLIDGSAYIMRAYHAMPKLTRKDGMPVGAVAGMCQFLWQFSANARGYTHIAVIRDGGHSGRGDLDANYKGNRGPRDEDLVKQYPLIDAAVAAWGMANVGKRGFEADDVIATYAKIVSNQGGRVTIYSSDKDLYQLMTWPGVDIFDPHPKFNRIMRRDDCIAKFGVPPEQVADLLALTGDTADNIKGIPNVGPVTAAKMLKGRTLDDVLERPDDLPVSDRFKRLVTEHADAVRLARKLVALNDEVPGLPFLTGLYALPPNYDDLVGFLRDMEFQQLEREILASLAAAA